MSLARVITVVTAALLAVVVSATSAVASTAPDTWPGDDENFTALHWIGTFIGGTLVLYAAIWIIAAAVNAKSRHHVVAPPSTDLEKAPGQDIAGH